MVLEPLQVFVSFENNSLDFKLSAPSKHLIPSFFYERPSLTQEKPFNNFSDRQDHEVFWYDLALQDSKGEVPDRPGVVSKYTFLLSKTINQNIFLNYISHKFYIYDRIKYLNYFSYPDLEDVFRQNENLAFISDPLEIGVPRVKDGASANPLIISQNTEQFKVVDFNPNRIQLITNFKTPKFLVYTDSYEKHWKVFINNQEKKLYRTNVAFKGVWLPAGEDKIDFQYTVMGEKELFLSVLILNLLFFLYFLKNLCIN